MKKLLVLLLVAFVLYFLFTQPEGMAGVLGNIGSTFAAGGESVIRFFNELF
ncbi:MAG TPA: hypothetical protein VK053_14740 [Jiangellaceae bacterium]|nr:hypothetical protein [Jiangellaceae bacterium]